MNNHGDHCYYLLDESIYINVLQILQNCLVYTFRSNNKINNKKRRRRKKEHGEEEGKEDDDER